MNERRGPNGERVEVVQTLTLQQVNMLRTAAERGSASAQYKLGLQHFAGMHVEQNFELAAALFRKAAEQGNPDAQEHLSQCYTQGQGVAQSATLGMEWARKAADQGSLQSQFNVGFAFARGTLQGIPFRRQQRRRSGLRARGEVLPHGREPGQGDIAIKHSTDL